MKKILMSLSVCCALVAMTACGSKSADKTEKAPENTESQTPPPADVPEEKESAPVEDLTPPTLAEIYIGVYEKATEDIKNAPSEEEAEKIWHAVQDSIMKIEAEHYDEILSEDQYDQVLSASKKADEAYFNYQSPRVREYNTTVTNEVVKIYKHAFKEIKIAKTEKEAEEIFRTANDDADLYLGDDTFTPTHEQRAQIDEAYQMARNAYYNFEEE